MFWKKKEQQTIFRFSGCREFHEYVDEHPEALDSVSPGGAAAALGISRQAVYDLIKRGKLRAWFVYDKDVGPALDVPGNRASYVYVSQVDILRRLQEEKDKGGRPKRAA